MNLNTGMRNSRNLLASGIVCWSAMGLAAEYNVFRTNNLERFITNVVEVNVPQNKFVNLYRTNLVQRVLTNTVDVYTTNLVRREVTNEILVTAYRTNWVEAYRTNLQAVTLTNMQTVMALRTNWVTVPMTNYISVQSFKTNLVDAYMTNVVSLNVTNWRTEVSFKTNVVSKPDSTEQAGNEAGSRTEPPRVGTETAAQPTSYLASDLILEASSKGLRLPNNQIEVLVRVKSAENKDLKVQQWRIESEDGSVLCFGQDQDFKRSLPVGRYKVEVRARKSSAESVLIARAVLGVTSQEVWVQAKPLALR